SLRKSVCSYFYFLISCSFIVLHAFLFPFLFFFFTDTATTEIYTLSLHDALPIFLQARVHVTQCRGGEHVDIGRVVHAEHQHQPRSEEHTSELQSPDHLVCRLLLEKKNTKYQQDILLTRAKMNNRKHNSSSLHSDS